MRDDRQAQHLPDRAHGLGQDRGRASHLARLLDYPFLDSDHEIELRTGADIPLIFEREGEAGFRQREREVIAEPHRRAGHRARHRRRRGARCRHARAICQPRLGGLSGDLGGTAGRARRAHAPSAAAARRRIRQQRLEELMRVREPLYREIADLTVSTDQRGSPRWPSGSSEDSSRRRSRPRVGPAHAGILAPVPARRRHMQTLTVRSRRSLLPDPDRLGPAARSTRCSQPHVPAPRRAAGQQYRRSRRCMPTRVRQALAGRRVVEVILPDGEQHKTLGDRRAACSTC